MAGWFLIFLLVATIVFIVVATARFSLHPFLVLLAAAYGLGLLAGQSPVDVVGAITDRALPTRRITVSAMTWAPPLRSRTTPITVPAAMMIPMPPTVPPKPSVIAPTTSIGDCPASRPRP